MWLEADAGHEVLARLPLLRVPLGCFGSGGGSAASLLIPIVPGFSDAEMLEHIECIKDLRAAREAARRPGTTFDATGFRLLIDAQPPGPRVRLSST